VHESIFVGDLSNDQKAAVTTLGNNWQRQLREPGSVGGNQSRFELEFSGAAQHLGDADRCSAEPMLNLRRIDGQTVISQEQGQALEARVLSPFRHDSPHRCGIFN
jgi:hypothetical protein